LGVTDPNSPQHRERTIATTAKSEPESSLEAWPTETTTENALQHLENTITTRARAGPRDFTRTLATTAYLRSRGGGEGRRRGGGGLGSDPKQEGGGGKPQI